MVSPISIAYILSCELRFLWKVQIPPQNVSYWSSVYVGRFIVCFDTTIIRMDVNASPQSPSPINCSTNSTPVESHLAVTMLLETNNRFLSLMSSMAVTGTEVSFICTIQVAEIVLVQCTLCPTGVEKSCSNMADICTTLFSRYMNTTPPPVASTKIKFWNQLWLHPRSEVWITWRVQEVSRISCLSCLW